MSEVPQAGQQVPSKSVAVGAVVGLATLVMMFAGVLFAYAFLRARADVWPPATEGTLPRLWPLLASASAVTGSAALWYWPARLRSLAAFTCTAVALCQGATLVQGYRTGLRPSSGPLGSVFFALTGLHALHVAILGLLIVALAPAGRRRAVGPAHPAWAWATHVLGALWLVIHGSLYLF